MSEIPQAIKDIRETAMGVVFARELEGLDQQSVELLEKIMNYMEKKYISVPMKLAREVMRKSVSKQ
jgi:glutamyl-tRNA reductase